MFKWRQYLCFHKGKIVSLAKSHHQMVKVIDESNKIIY